MQVKSLRQELHIVGVLSISVSLDPELLELPVASGITLSVRQYSVLTLSLVNDSIHSKGSKLQTFFNLTV